MRLLVPPSGSVPGDVLYLAGGSATEAAAKQVKSDDWKKIVEGLSVQVRTRGEDALYRYTVPGICMPVFTRGFLLFETQRHSLWCLLMPWLLLPSPSVLHGIITGIAGLLHWCLSGDLAWPHHTAE